MGVRRRFIPFVRTVAREWAVSTENGARTLFTITTYNEKPVNRPRPLDGWAPGEKPERFTGSSNAMIVVPSRTELTRYHTIPFVLGKGSRLAEVNKASAAVLTTPSP